MSYSTVFPLLLQLLLDASTGESYPFLLHFAVSIAWLNKFHLSYILLLFLRLRADLAVGYDLAPLSLSAVGAIKSLASAIAAKFGL